MAENPKTCVNSFKLFYFYLTKTGIKMYYSSSSEINLFWMNGQRTSTVSTRCSLGNFAFITQKNCEKYSFPVTSQLCLMCLPSCSLGPR